MRVASLKAAPLQPFELLPGIPVMTMVIFSLFWVVVTVASIFLAPELVFSYLSLESLTVMLALAGISPNPLGLRISCKTAKVTLPGSGTMISWNTLAFLLPKTSCDAVCVPSDGFPSPPKAQLPLTGREVSAIFQPPPDLENEPFTNTGVLASAEFLTLVEDSEEPQEKVVNTAIDAARNAVVRRSFMYLLDARCQNSRHKRISDFRNAVNT
jgi:hypothetical protein